MRDERLRLGLTQQALATRMRLTKAAVSNYEKKPDGPSLDTVIRFAHETGADLNWILLGREPVGELDRRIRDLPDALKETVMATLILAEFVKRQRAIQFVQAPPSDKLPDFMRYLLELAESPPVNS